MSKEDQVEFSGTVIAIPGGGLSKVLIESEKGVKVEVLATLSGKMKQHKIKVVVGDTVRVAVSPYDYTKGRITFRDRT